MRHRNIVVIAALAFILIAVGGLKIMSQDEPVKQDKNMKYNKLTDEEKRVIIDKGTERPFTGKYYNFHEKGVYTCKQCGAVLFRSSDKFDSNCGWPSFDDAIPGAVKRVPDADGLRTEIICNNCGAHLGHVFMDEGFTAKNTRNCVNSISLNFVPDKAEQKTDTAYFAGGCFWGVEYNFEKIDGVISVISGYMGGHIDNPTYEEVCSHTTGFAETVQVIFDPSKTDYETLARLFFEIHDPTQMNRQGPDVGDQYRSEIFYMNDQQKTISEKLIKILKDKGYDVVTKVEKAGKFWKAEDYHQDYYERTGKEPYCHIYTKRF